MRRPGLGIPRGISGVFRVVDCRFAGLRGNLPPMKLRECIRHFAFIRFAKGFQVGEGE